LKYYHQMSSAWRMYKHRVSTITVVEYKSEGKDEHPEN